MTLIVSKKLYCPCIQVKYWNPWWFSIDWDEKVQREKKKVMGSGIYEAKHMGNDCLPKKQIDLSLKCLLSGVTTTLSLKV